MHNDRYIFLILVNAIGPAVRADFRRLYPANAKTPTCCPSDDNRTKVTNSVTSARSLWWHVGPYFWPADLTRTANPIVVLHSHNTHAILLEAKKNSQLQLHVYGELGRTYRTDDTYIDYRNSF